MRFKMKLFIMSIMVFCLTGCWDIRETENTFYITALGLDYQNGQYIAYAQFNNFSNVSKTGSSPSQTKPVVVAKGTGKILIDTGYSLYTTSQRKISFEHIKTLIVSDRILKQGGMKQILEFMSRFVQFRKTMWIFGTQKLIPEILTTVGPFQIPSIITIQSDPRNIYEQYSRFEPLRMFQFEAYYFEPANTAYLPFLTTSKIWIEGNKPLNQLKYDGVGFFAHSHYVEHMSEKELIGFKWTNPNLVRAPITVMKNGKPAAKLLLRDPKVKIQSYQRNGKTAFQMKVKFQAEIYQLIQFMPLNILEKYANQELERQIYYTYNKGLQRGIDVYQLSHVFYRDQIALWKEWKKRHGREQLLLDKSSLSLKAMIKIETGGQMKIKNEQ
ncbi:germination protein, Ger(x)C family [Seinonella peptonophila]|uniref:Germination protein, Ger(X)C family n=1 Tax=Seinonella peptonophila TaxID=112248 RepID=A0A1M5BAV2_9BACL|nr:Ger(x)C family spore germination protein [Seinonella peptonophila]SHF39457.1 germination protein, Ger(x)C family [Seinonella peptonophila]